VCQPWYGLQFGKGLAEGKYDWTADGKQQLLLPSEFKKACSAKTPCPVISWLPEIISVCWKIASELVIKLDNEKGIRQELFDWIDASSRQRETAKKDVGDDIGTEEKEGKDGEKEEGDADMSDHVRLRRHSLCACMPEPPACLCVDS
jgi:hypothetical protein